MTRSYFDPAERGLAGLAGIAAAVLLLLLATAWLRTGSATGFDPAILVRVRAVTGNGGPLVALAKGITAFGNDVTLWIATIAVTGFLLALRRTAAAVQLAAVAASGGLMTTAIKLLVSRPRPAVVEHLVEVHPLSFPSGHATNSALVYGTLALIAVAATSSPAGRGYLAVLTALLVVLIGASRVILGVHWPTDVLSGWVLGASWALLGNRIAGRLASGESK